jgi:pimeloyl-ACP methyl ester carboxylesterase
MMAVVSKKLIISYYGAPPTWSYWNGCSTGGRQGLMMAQRYPDDYDGVLAGAPAIHWDKFQAYQIWPQMAMSLDAGGSIDSGKQAAVTAAAIKACDALDGVVDGVLRDPRACTYDAHNFTGMTAGEASAMNKIWGGSQNLAGELLWYGVKRGASMQGLAGHTPFAISVAQPKYWIYLNPEWDWHTLNYSNYQTFFDLTTTVVNPVIGSDYPDLSKFEERGSKLVIWHGWSDQLIMPEGSIDYYAEVVNATSGGDLKKTQDFARLFMAPGISHCGMGTDPYFEAVVKWVEKGVAPEAVLHQVSAKTARPLCPHPTVAVYKGTGSTDDAANFFCGDGTVKDNENAARRGNERVFGVPFLPPSNWTQAYGKQ